MFALGRQAFNTEKNPITKQKYVIHTYASQAVGQKLEFDLFVFINAVIKMCRNVAVCADSVNL